MSFRSVTALDLMFLVFGALSPPAAAQTTTRISVDSAGEPADLGGQSAAISADGRFIAYHSRSTNLVPGDSNGVEDIFCYDLLTGLTSRLSVNAAGVQGDRYSWNPSISGDGRYVAFESSATNLVPGDTNLATDVFVHDRQTGLISRASVDSHGLQASGSSFGAAISADGRSVAFTSEATDLVSGDANASVDVFVHNRLTGQTSRVSVDSAGVAGNHTSQSPSISADGQIVSFQSLASNLVPGDTNAVYDVFVHDRLTGQTIRISVDSAGMQGNQASTFPTISASGGHVAFSSLASNFTPGDTNNLDDVFVHDLLTAQTSCVSLSPAGAVGNQYSIVSDISADGSSVVFFSASSNLLVWDTNDKSDVLVHDRQSGHTSRVSVNSSGGQGNSASFTSTRSRKISSDGRFVIFESLSGNFDHHDTNGSSDIFLRDRGAPNLARSGRCPGAITLTIVNATSGGRLAIACGSAGRLVRAASPCAGLLLSVSPPAKTTIHLASGAGTLVLHLSAPAGICGSSVQAVDVTTCAASNVIVL